MNLDHAPSVDQTEAGPAQSPLSASTVWDRAVVPVRTGAEMAQAQNLGNEETSERLWKGAGFGAGRDGI